MEIKLIGIIHRVGGVSPEVTIRVGSNELTLPVAAIEAIRLARYLYRAVEIIVKIDDSEVSNVQNG